MISLKKYLDLAHSGPQRGSNPEADELLPAAIAAYRSALVEIGSCSMEVCPTLGEELQRELGKTEKQLASEISPRSVENTARNVREQLQGWSKRVAGHFQKQIGDVKEILLVMARTAESVGERDQRCAKQINEVTAQLQRIANLEDLTQIRASLKKSAAELKTSIDKMTADGKAALEHARVEISAYQTKLEEAEQIASRDSLTGLRNRLWVESQIERRIDEKLPICVGIIDLNGFKQVNDEHGHLVGDELLKQFAAELKSACRMTDVVGRWGGDEFIILLHCELASAKTQVDRLRAWVCGSYTVQSSAGPMKVAVSASIGLAEHRPEETMKALLSRADAEMYQEKSASRGGLPGLKR